MSRRAILLIGTPTGIVQPDATEDFSASIETSITMDVEGKTWTPAGSNGEVIVRRAYLIGWHTGAVAFWFTPKANGREMRSLRTYCSAPATANGSEERFNFLVPLFTTSARYPNVRLGLRTSAISGIIEITSPPNTFYIEKLVLAHQFLNSDRAKTASES